jgi:acetyl esterase/lipase
MKLDPEIAATLVAMAEAAGGRLPPPADTLPELRAQTDTGLGAMFARLPAAPDVQVRRFAATASDGAAIPLGWYEKAGSTGGAAVIYVHGGGMIAGSTSVYDPLIRHYVALSRVPFLAVGYRLAPEHRDTGLARDVLAAVAWLKAEAPALGIDPERIAIMGDSGGGGIAAAAAAMARDAGLKLARQILIYPMLDDRNLTPDPALAPTATWTYEKNRLAWSAVLGDAFGTDAVSPALAPARLEALAGLPSAYVEVGELDIFRDESIAFASRLEAAGVPCELHVVPGAPHGHDWINLDAAISRQVFEARSRVLASL